MSLKNKFKNLLSEEEEPKPESSEEKEELNFKEISQSLLAYSKKDITYYLLLIPVLALSLYIRLSNMHLLKGKYLLGLDPYYFYRLAGEVLTQGHLSPIDYMRLPPFGAETGFRTMAYFLAGWHNFVSIFTGQPLIYSNMIYPPIFAIIGFFFFFLFTKELFGNKVAFVSTALFAVLPGYLYRTMAGFADHEALAMALLFISLWLFVKFKKEKVFKKQLVYAATSGFIGSLMALTWPAAIILVIILLGLIIVEILFEILKNKKIILYFTWIIFFLTPILIVKGLNLDTRIAIIFFGILLIITYLGFQKTKIISKIKFPKGILSIIFSSLISGLIVFLGFFNSKKLIAQILQPAEQSGRVSQTVSEIIGGIRIWENFGFLSILALLGIIILSYFLFEKNIKKSLIFSSISGLSFILLIFGKFEEVYNLVLLTIPYLVIFAFRIISLKNKKELKINLMYFIPLILFSIAAYLSKTAARFIFVFTPFVALIGGYFLVDLGKKVYSKKSLKFFTIFILLIFLGLFYMNASGSFFSAQRSGSNLPGQWENSMSWISENTAEDAVIAHWWDYGYWTQAIGERTSIADGGAHGEYPLFLLGRYGMTAHNTSNALTYFKSHNVTHLLFSSEEIGKYHAFSYIGSDKNFDRESTIGTFSLAQQKEVRNGTVQIYQGGWALDKDIKIDNLVLPKNKAVLAGIQLSSDTQGNLKEAPKAVIIHNNKQYVDNISCMYINNEKIELDVESNLKGCIKYIPYINENMQIMQNGAILYLSEKVYPGLFARLYLLNESVNGFKEVYSDQTPLAVYRGRTIGPVKIWNVTYPENISVEQRFLENATTYDPNFRLAE